MRADQRNETIDSMNKNIDKHIPGLSMILIIAIIYIFCIFTYIAVRRCTCLDTCTDRRGLPSRMTSSSPTLLSRQHEDSTSLTCITNKLRKTQTMTLSVQFLQFIPMSAQIYDENKNKTIKKNQTIFWNLESLIT